MQARIAAVANAMEAQALADELAHVVELQATLPPDACQSIGIVSPFRDQVDLIASDLARRLSLDAFARHDLRVGTAHAFQGDERDVMFVSFVVDDAAHHSSFRFLTDPNLFNVTITRAGFSLFPLPYRCWLRDQAACIQAITRRLGAVPG